MATESADELTSAIGDSFESVVQAGLDIGGMAGAYDADIDAMAAAQDVECIPEAVRVVLRLIGARPGSYELVAGSLGPGAVGRAHKRLAVELLHELPAEELQLVDPDNVFVIAVYEGEVFAIVDGSHLSDPNPPVWRLEGDYALEKRWSSVTEWFSVVSDDLIRIL